MSEKLNKTRTELIDIFTSALKEDTLPWHRTWDVKHPPFGSHTNPITNTKYRGVNAALLWFVSMIKGYEDPRWITFKQMADREWKFGQPAKGKGMPVEYWYIWYSKEKKSLTFPEADAIVKKDKKSERDMRKCSKTYTVFNAELIDGIEPLQKEEVVRKPFTNTMLKKLFSS